MIETVNSELSCDPQALERSETTTDKAEEAEINRAGTREEIKHFPKLRLPVCS